MVDTSANRFSGHPSVRPAWIPWAAWLALLVWASGCSLIVQFDDPPPVRCGNGIVDGEESCDGEDLGSASSCQDHGYTGGSLSCSADCSYQFAECTGGGCGDLVVQGGEQCDATDFGGHSCESLGYPGGRLLCRQDCTFDTSGCHTGCGDGWCHEEGDEPETCAEDCYASCGNNRCEINGGEDRTDCPQDCGWIAVSAGGRHSCGIKADGVLYCWGENGRGAVGDGSGVNQPVPVPVDLPGPVTAVAAGWGHTCALTEGDALFCWGRNESGQLGDGTVMDRLTPVAVPSLADVRVVSAGTGYTCAARANGSGYCWGANSHGQLGLTHHDGDPGCPNGPCYFSPQPVAPASSPTMTAMAASLAAGPFFAHTLAVDRNTQQFWAWGSNQQQQLSQESGDQYASPQALFPLDAPALLAAGGGFSCAVDGGAVQCWGTQESGRLGNGVDSVDATSTPVSVLHVESVVSLSAGAGHACAVTNGPALWCWGEGSSGQLGSNDLAAAPEPLEVPNLGALPTQVSAGGAHTCVRLDSGALLCSGDNDQGQLGTGEASRSAVFLEVAEPQSGLDTRP